MDKIGEEFDFIRSNFEAQYQTGFARWYKGKYISLIDTPINLDHVKVLNKQFTAYKLGYYCHKANSRRSRDKEIEKWRIRNDKQEAKIIDQDEEIKKLRDALEGIIETEYVDKPEALIIDDMVYLAKQALKDGE